jgi:hypothetical protein
MTGFEFPSTSWIQAATSNPALFLTWLHCGTVHYHIIQGRIFKTRRSFSQAIPMSSSSSSSSTSNSWTKKKLAARVTPLLSWNGSLLLRRTDTTDQRSPSQGPVKSLQSSDVNSSMRFVPLQVGGLAMLIEMRGGLEMIEMEPRLNSSLS